MRSLGRGLALLLVVGAVLSAVTGDGFARVLGAISGYADFGYAPEACGTSTSVARAINGEKVRVCQDTYSTTSGFFAGHELTGVGYAFADLRVSLPDQQVVYSCCNAQENWFSDAIFEPLVPGAGTIHSDAGTFVRVAQTARPTASGYTVVYAITNLTQSPLHVRPAASMSGYYWDTPVVDADRRAARAQAAPARHGRLGHARGVRPRGFARAHELQRRQPRSDRRVGHRRRAAARQHAPRRPRGRRRSRADGDRLAGRPARGGRDRALQRRGDARAEPRGAAQARGCAAHARPRRRSSRRR